MSETELYSSIHVVEAGLPGEDGVARRSYSVGQNGVVEIRKLPDLRVRVVRTERADFDFWPHNVVLGTPLRTSCPVQPEVAPVATLSPSSAAASQGDHSAVAQLVEHLPVKQGDEGSSPSCGASSEEERNTDAGVAQAEEQGSCKPQVGSSTLPSGSEDETGVRGQGNLSASKTERLDSIPGEPAKRETRPWRKGRGR